MVVGAFPVVSETFILHQITGLLDLGHDVRIISLNRPPANAPVHSAVEEYSLLDRTTYVDLPTSRPRLAQTGLSAFGWLVARYGRRAVSGMRLMQRRWGLPHPFDLTCTRLLCPTVEGCDIVHAQFGPNALTALPAALTGGLPLVVTLHGYDLRRCIATDGACCQSLFTHADRVLAISEYSARALSDCGLSHDKMTLHRVGIRTDDFPFTPSGSDRGGKVCITTVARLVEEKGLDVAVRVIRALRDRIPSVDVEYGIVGGGPLHEDLVELRDELGLGNAVSFLGPCDAPEVRRALQRADVFLLTSRDEVTPVVLMEAQATGLPIVAVGVGAVAEVVEDGVSGFVVPQRDVDALAERLQYLIEHPGLWPEMGRAGRKLVEEKFDLRKLNRRLVSIYEDVIAGRAPRPGVP